jgi:hypothetical protein
LTRKVVRGILYPYKSGKNNAQKSEIFTNINVYGSMDMPLVVLG